MAQPQSVEGRQGLLFVLSAPSGGGKTSLCQRVVAELSGVVQSVSYTTRPPRPEERDGREYHFITLQAFQQCCDHKAFLECAQVHEHWYGTSRQQIETATHAGLDVLLAIDVQGAMQLRTRDVEAVHIFVLPPSWAELEARLRARGSEAESTLARRLAVAQQELAHYTAYDYVIINNQLDQATAVLKAIIMAERHRVARVGTAPVTSLLETKEVQR
jgi:guanylate kinase